MMTIEQTRAKIVGSIWQALAQSGVNLAALPHEDQEKLVNAIANNVLLTVNDLLNDVPKPPPTSDSPAAGEEQVLWQGRPFLSLAESYILTTERIKVSTGVLSRDVENFELIRVQDIDYSQGLSERILGIGDISIRGADPSEPVLVLRNISKPEEVYEILRKAWLAARQRYGLQFREQM